MFLFSYML